MIMVFNIAAGIFHSFAKHISIELFFSSSYLSTRIRGEFVASELGLVSILVLPSLANQSFVAPN